MLERLRTAILVSRVRGAGIAILGGGLCLLALVIMPGGALPVPGRSGVFTRIWPLTPAIAAAFLPVLLQRQQQLAEICSPRYQPRRAADIAAFTATQLAILSCAPWFSPAILTRNYLLCFGVVAIFARLLGSKASWFPLVFLITLTWLLGTEIGGETKPWATLLHAPHSISAWAASVLLAALGAAILLLIDPQRPTR